MGAIDNVELGSLTGLLDKIMPLLARQPNRVKEAVKMKASLMQ